MEATELLAGMIRRTLYVIHSEPNPDAPEGSGADLFPVHLQHIINWEQQGVLFAAGPIIENGAVTPRAMYILRAESLEAAIALAAEEPLHRHGVRSFKAEEWLLSEGRIGLSIDFSTQRGGLDECPFPSADDHTHNQGA